jgi:hypothetical protein
MNIDLQKLCPPLKVNAYTLTSLLLKTLLLPQPRTLLSLLACVSFYAQPMTTLLQNCVLIGCSITPFPSEAIPSPPSHFHRK